MITNEAHDFTLGKVNELKEIGIDVIIKPYDFSKHSDKDDLIKEFTEDIRTLSHKWCNVSFKIENKFQSQKIHEMANYLGMCGIAFDTGGCCGCRYWELDWSFKYIPGEENEEWRAAREGVEDTINDLNNTL